MQLGAFSISLTVKDLAASKAFYEKLGFETSGKLEDNWLIMKNDHIIIGLFHGMFDKNMLTFNPGWNQDANTLGDFEDIRDIQKKLLAEGLELLTKAEDGTGPASIILEDPDGNPILMDQHV